MIIMILASILSGMTAGEVLYKFIRSDDLIDVTKLSFILVLIIGIVFHLIENDVTFLTMSILSGVSMAIYVLIRTHLKFNK